MHFGIFKTQTHLKQYLGIECILIHMVLEESTSGQYFRNILQNKGDQQWEKLIQAWQVHFETSIHIN